ncbi:MAG: glycosyltransferase, partial [Candidatus Margulisbacteria bacterium]|nr:glycosyltransferase [Candidatus Margulisiibacteriota bacterium]
MKDLSIIIVNANNKKLLKECLTSVYQDTHKICFEVIVVDNASTDGSPAMITSKFPEVKLIENKDNLGFAKANNQG